MFLAIVLSLWVLVWIVLRAFRSRMIYWGSTPEERLMPMPESEKLGNLRIVDTLAITIFASPEKIWSFLVQIGQNRGGFYSYRWLENLFGCKMPNIEKIVPELQKISLGDKVYLHPKAPPLTVTVLEQNKVLAFGGWYLLIVPQGPMQTRLITRSYDWRDPSKKSKFADFIFSGVIFDFARFVMERKMLLNIKRLAESAQPVPTPAWVWPTLGWLGLLATAFVNGALREIGMKKIWGMPDLLAHQLSCLTGALLWTAFAVLIWNKLKISSLRKSYWLGLGWFVPTALFETFVLNRNMTWAEILSTYNLAKGELWGLALFWIGLLPTVIYLIKNRKRFIR